MHDIQGLVHNFIKDIHTRKVNGKERRGFTLLLSLFSNRTSENSTIISPTISSALPTPWLSLNIVRIDSDLVVAPYSASGIFSSS